MTLLIVAGVISVLLFGAGTYLLIQAGAKPPVAIRTESGRSPAEHAFRTNREVFRQGSMVCLIVGALNLVAAAFLAAISVPAN